MTSWIDNLPPDMASAIVDFNLLAHLAPSRAIVTATFGIAPEISSDATLDDITHLEVTSPRSEFVHNILNSLGISSISVSIVIIPLTCDFFTDSPYPINQVFFFLSTTPVARTWSHTCSREKPFLASRLLEFLLEIQNDITLLRSCATLLSQVLGGASSAAIWESTFQILNPRAPPALPVSPVSLETAPRPHSEVLYTSDSLDPPISNTLVSAPTGTIKTHQTPVKANSGTSVYQTETHMEVDPLIRAELRGLVFPNTPGFMDAFFHPYKSTASELLPKFAGIRSADRWSTFPSPPRPLSVEAWYLNIANRALACTGANRQYRASPTQALNGHDSVRKPDLILLDSAVAAGAPSAEFDWSDVLVVGELKQAPDKGLDVDTIVQLAGYVRIIFATQHTRRFVHGFTLCSDSMRCWVFHRGGVFGSDAFNINKDPLLFLSAILGYAGMTDVELGFDPTLSLAHEGIRIGDMSEEIKLAAVPFFHPAAIASRGTRCWEATLVADETVQYVLKDSWRSVHHGSEGEMLQKARDRNVIGIVEFIAYEDVMVDGKTDDLFANVMKGLQVGKAVNLVIPQSSRSASRASATADEAPTVPASRRKSSLAMRLIAADGEDPPTPPTSTHQKAPASPSPASTSTKRKLLPSAADETTSSARKRAKTSAEHASILHFTGSNRIHTRILTVKGRPITTFTSAHELLLAFVGAIKGHQSLYQNRILHRDVSINNIMITLCEHPRADGLCGFLIDLDLAIETSVIAPSGAPHRTGTMEFMAIGALNREVHTFRHDLESFLYVLLWICINYRPAHKGLPRHVPFRKGVLDSWGGTFEGAAVAKWGDMGRATVGSRQGLERLLGAFEGWAAELKGVARKFRDVLFPVVADGVMKFSEGEGVYGDVLRMLQESAEKL